MIGAVSAGSAVVDGVQIYFDERDKDVALPLLTDGDFDTALRLLVNHTIKPSMVVADVGAHIGLFSLFAARRAIHVHAFEPAPVNVAYLRRNVEANQLSNVTITQAAVSDKAGELTFYLMPGHTMGHSAFRSSWTSEALTVPAVTLDEAFAGKQLDFVKIDVDGHEMAVLAGMIKTLKRPNLQLVIELSNASITREAGYEPVEQLELLASYGFQFHRIDKQGLPYPVSQSELLRALSGGAINVYCVRP